jgi:hypothetical protein
VFDWYSSSYFINTQWGWLHLNLNSKVIHVHFTAAFKKSAWKQPGKWNWHIKFLLKKRNEVWGRDFPLARTPKSIWMLRVVVTAKKTLYMWRWPSYCILYIGRFQNVPPRCPTPRLHCLLSSHCPSCRFLSFMAFLTPSIHYNLLKVIPVQKRLFVRILLDQRTLIRGSYVTCEPAFWWPALEGVDWNYLDWNAVHSWALVYAAMELQVLYSTRIEMLLASWGKAGSSKRTPPPYRVAMQRSRRDVPNMVTSIIESSHSLNTAVQKSHIISSSPLVRQPKALIAS